MVKDGDALAINLLLQETNHNRLTGFIDFYMKNMYTYTIKVISFLGYLPRQSEAIRNSMEL